jgi:hypothetical protein
MHCHICIEIEDFFLAPSGICIPGPSPKLLPLGSGRTAMINSTIGLVVVFQLSPMKCVLQVLLTLSVFGALTEVVGFN